MAQFVPVKLDVDTPEYTLWQREHPSKGTTIPKLFVVRADDETLYGRSGALEGRELPDMLVRALQRSGRILTPREASALNKAADQFEALSQQGEFARAVKAINRVSKLGQPGKIPSFAASASRINELANATADQVKSRLKELTSQLEADQITERLAATMEILELRRNYGALKIIKSDLAVAYRKCSAQGAGQLAREARTIDNAKSADTKSKRTRAIEKLRQLVAESEIEEVKALAETTITELESMDIEN